MYYYAVAKDFEQNFIHIQAVIDHPDSSEKLYFLNSEPIEVSELPSGLLTEAQAAKLSNVLLFKIDLNLSELPAGKDQLMTEG